MYEKFAKNELKNNLFEYATSELSQDAFICWLASYAHEEAEKMQRLMNVQEKCWKCLCRSLKAKILNFLMLSARLIK